MIRCSISITAIAGINIRRAAIATATQTLSYTRNAPEKSTAVESSSRGYLGEIRAPQFRHRPRSRTHPRIGTLSRLAISTPQVGHRERGRTTDSPAGTRAVTTVMKLPSASPSGNVTIARSQPTGEPYRRGCRALEVELLPEGSFVRRSEPEHSLDPRVVKDVIAVLQVHAPRVEGALAGRLARRVVLERHLAGRVEQAHHAVIGVGDRAWTELDGVLAVDAAIAAVRRACGPCCRLIGGNHRHVGGDRRRGGSDRARVPEVDRGVRHDREIPAQRDPVQADLGRGCRRARRARHRLGARLPHPERPGQPWL